jgi:hypothetical protein
LNTHVCSDPARFPDYPPLEAMFKGGPIVNNKMQHLLENLCAGGDFGPMPWLSVTVGPKGSYRQEHVLRYLKRHLEPMTPTRRWRILMCDVYAAHLDEEVIACAHQHGYIMVYHGGGCTGVLQCNDTHLHQTLSSRYQALEMVDLLEQSRLQPHGCPSRDREDCVRDAAATWRDSQMHALAARGHLDNMLCNALDGSQDHLGQGDAMKFWKQLDMGTKRAAAMQDVAANHANHTLTWATVPTCVHPFPKRGTLDTYVDGQDDEGEAPGGQAWSDREDPSTEEEVSDDCAGGPSAGELMTGIGSTSTALSQQQALVVGEVTERIRQVEDMIVQAHAFGNPHIVQTLEKARHTLIRQSSGAQQQDPAIAQAARDVRLSEQYSLLEARSRISAAKAEKEAGLKTATTGKARARASDTFRKESRLIRHRRLNEQNSDGVAVAIPKGFDAADLGQGKKNGGSKIHSDNRHELFARVAVNFPALAGELAVNFNRTWNLWDAQMSRRHSDRWGHMFRDKMLRMQATGKAGDNAAMRRFTEQMVREVPSAEIAA